MTTLLQAYLTTGMIQCGRFKQPDGSYSPLSFNFLLLPSFPALMQQTAQAFLPLLQAASTDRLLALRSTVAVGAVLAVQSGIPLTYQYGEMRGITNAYIIEGAYDIGHPTALLTDVVGHDSDALAILDPARKVGLQVTDVLAICQVGQRHVMALAQAGIRLHSLFNLANALPQLQSSLPAPMLAHLDAWFSDL
jgi:orotate phosphoribosyltransferase